MAILLGSREERFRGDALPRRWRIAVVDFFDSVAERNEANNVAVSPAIVTQRGRPSR